MSDVTGKGEAHGQVTTITYDALGCPTTIILPDGTRLDYASWLSGLPAPGTRDRPVDGTQKPDPSCSDTPCPDTSAPGS